MLLYLNQLSLSSCCAWKKYIILWWLHFLTEFHTVWWQTKEELRLPRIALMELQILLSWLTLRHFGFRLVSSESYWLESCFKVWEHSDMRDRCRGRHWSSWNRSSRTPPKAAWFWIQSDLDHCYYLVSDGLSEQEISIAQSKHTALAKIYTIIIVSWSPHYKTTNNYFHYLLIYPLFTQLINYLIVHKMLNVML